jgi:uncharacterized protein (DUF2141 family)
MEAWMRTGTPLAVAALLMTPFAQADPPPCGVLTARIAQLRSNDGQVGCMLYSAAKGFPTDPSAAVQKRWCPIRDKTSTCSFDPTPAGTYAVACFHDENNNGKLDRGLFGIPKEGTVVSNHARGLMGPPSFEKARFTWAGVAAELSLRMAY